MQNDIVTPLVSRASSVLDTSKPLKISNFLALSLIIGFAPVLDAIMLRSYGYGVQPNWLESLRILDFPEILLESFVILWARHSGMDFNEYWRKIPILFQGLTLVFISTFWIGTALSSPIPDISIIRSFYWLIHLGFGLSVYHLIKSDQIDVALFLKCQLAGLAILTVIIIIYLVHMTQLPSAYADQIKWAGAIPGFMSVRHFGILTGSVTALYVGYFCWTAPQTLNLRSAFFICIWLIGLTVWSGTRSAALGLLVGFVVIAFAMKSIPPFKKLGIITLASILAILLSTLFLPPDMSFGFFRWVDANANSTADSFSSGRLTIWLFAWDLFLDRWAFGWGEGAMYGIEISGTSTYHLQPHNSIVQFFYSWGVVGAVAMITIITGIILNLHRKLKLNNALAGPLMMVDAMLIMSLLDGVLFFSRMIMPIIFCLAICLTMQRTAAINAP